MKIQQIGHGGSKPLDHMLFASRFPQKSEKAETDKAF